MLGPKCGPQGKGLIARFLRWTIREQITIRGQTAVFTPCCSNHDEDNEKNGANKAGDEALKKCLRCVMADALFKKREILLISNLYYLGVRFGNPFYKTSAERWGDFRREMRRLKIRIMQGLGL